MVIGSYAANLSQTPSKDPTVVEHLWGMNVNFRTIKELLRRHHGNFTRKLEKNVVRLIGESEEEFFYLEYFHSFPNLGWDKNTKRFKLPSKGLISRASREERDSLVAMTVMAGTYYRDFGDLIGWGKVVNWLSSVTEESDLAERLNQVLEDYLKNLKDALKSLRVKVNYLIDLDNVEKMFDHMKQLGADAEVAEKGVKICEKHWNHYQEVKKSKAECEEHKKNIAHLKVEQGTGTDAEDTDRKGLIKGLEKSLGRCLENVKRLESKKLPEPPDWTEGRYKDYFYGDPPSVRVFSGILNMRLTKNEYRIKNALLSLAKIHELTSPKVEEKKGKDATLLSSDEETKTMSSAEYADIDLGDEQGLIISGDESGDTLTIETPSADASSKYEAYGGVDESDMHQESVDEPDVHNASTGEPDVYNANMGEPDAHHSNLPLNTGTETLKNPKVDHDSVKASPLSKAANDQVSNSNALPAVETLTEAEMIKTISNKKSKKKSPPKPKKVRKTRGERGKEDSNHKRDAKNSKPRSKPKGDSSSKPDLKSKRSKSRSKPKGLLEAVFNETGTKSPKSRKKVKETMVAKDNIKPLRRKKRSSEKKKATKQSKTDDPKKPKGNLQTALYGLDLSGDLSD
jgi:hypothetical protein